MIFLIFVGYSPQHAKQSRNPVKEKSNLSQGILSIKLEARWWILLANPLEKKSVSRPSKKLIMFCHMMTPMFSKMSLMKLPLAFFLHFLNSTDAWNNSALSPLMPKTQCKSRTSLKEEKRKKGREGEGGRERIKKEKVEERKGKRGEEGRGGEKQEIIAQY